MGQHKFNPFARGSTVPPPTTIMDAYGRVLDPGDEVILRASIAPCARIQRVQPILDPKAPPGMVLVTMTSVWQLPMQAGVPLQQMIRTQTVAEAIDAGILKRTEEPPAEGAIVGADGQPPTND